MSDIILLTRHHQSPYVGIGFESLIRDDTKEACNSNSLTERTSQDPGISVSLQMRKKTTIM